MRLSIYTFVKDGLFLDFHVVAKLRHHLSLADEIVGNEGYRNDSMFEAISYSTCFRTLVMIQTSSSTSPRTTARIFEPFRKIPRSSRGTISSRCTC
jgi:hypothetical protein